ncbi:MAG: primosomal protein N', partial [Bacteroidota bacterium]
MKSTAQDIFSGNKFNQLLYADVIVPLALPRTYTWIIPEAFTNIIQPGVRVEVELRKKRYAGIVKSIHQNKPESFEPKELINLLDSDPIVYPEQLQFWNWLSRY